MEYPTTLSEIPQPLPANIDQSFLHERDLEVMVGLTPELAEQLIENSKQEHIVASCEHDADERFVDMDSLQAWQERGHLVLPLVRKLGNGTLRLVGIGWFRAGESRGEHGPIPGSKATLAIRLYQEGLRQGIAPHYLRVMLDAHEQLIGSNDGMTLKTFSDNQKALRSYYENGFEVVDHGFDTRHGEQVPIVIMALGATASEHSV